MDLIKLPLAVNDTNAPILLLLQFEEGIKFSHTHTHTHTGIPFFKEKKDPDFTHNSHPEFRQRDYR